jgi:hypothetical protein
MREEHGLRAVRARRRDEHSDVDRGVQRGQRGERLVAQSGIATADHDDVGDKRPELVSRRDAEEPDSVVLAGRVEDDDRRGRIDAIALGHGGIADDIVGFRGDLAVGQERELLDELPRVLADLARVRLAAGGNEHRQRHGRRHRSSAFRT